MITLRKIHYDAANIHSLVLLHAFPLTSSMWKEAVATIVVHAPLYNIILVDLPGFGNSAVLKSWTIAEAIVELHRQLKQEGVVEPVIGGLSMGGYAAFAYYRLYHNEVKALILSNTKAEADDEKGKKGREEFARDVEQSGYDAVYERMLPKLVSGSSRKNNPELIKKLESWIEGSTREAIATALRALALRDDSTDLLETISCPTLVITGEDDAIIPEDTMREMALVIHGAKFVSFMKSGHLTAVEQPEKWGSIVGSFLNIL